MHVTSAPEIHSAISRLLSDVIQRTAIDLAVLDGATVQAGAAREADERAVGAAISAILADTVRRAEVAGLDRKQADLLFPVFGLDEAKLGRPEAARRLLEQIAAGAVVTAGTESRGKLLLHLQRAARKGDAEEDRTMAARQLLREAFGASNAFADVPSLRGTSTAEVQDTVRRLLRYVIRRNDMHVEEDLIHSVVPLLRRPPNLLTVEEEAVLWAACNTLTVKISPATEESIALAQQVAQLSQSGNAPDERKRLRSANQCQEHLRWSVRLMMSAIILYAVMQIYAVVLGDALLDLKKLDNELKGVDSQIEMALLSHPQGSPTPQPVDAAYRAMVSKRMVLQGRVDAMAEAMVTYSPTRFLVRFVKRKPGPSPFGDDDRNALTELPADYFVIIQVTESMLKGLSLYLLPTVLGLIGSIAYLMRRHLDQLDRESFVVRPRSRYMMRLGLGMLLGVISGVLIAPAEGDVKGFNMSLVTVALLMGYSVELAFAAFDAAVKRGLASMNSIGPSSDLDDGSPTASQPGSRPKPGGSRPTARPNLASLDLEVAGGKKAGE